MFLRRSPLLSLLGVALLATGCDSTPTPSKLSQGGEGRPTVVATLGPLCDLSQQIAGETIALTCLIEPGQDPHTYTPTPADRARLETARLILYGGYGIEGSLLKSIQATRGRATQLAVYESAVPKPLLGRDDGHDHDGHDHGDEQGGSPTAEAAKGNDQPADPQAAKAGKGNAGVPDPHVWHDAAHGAQIAETIAQALSQVQPAQADRYRRATVAITAQLKAIDAWIHQQVATVPRDRRQLVTPHNAFSYYAAAYGLTVKATLSGLSTAERPSVGHLAELVEQIKAAQVPAIFAESTTSPKTIATLAKNAGVKVADRPLWVEGPGGPNSTAPTYQAMLIENTCTIVTALGGRCDAPVPGLPQDPSRPKLDPASP